MFLLFVCGTHNAGTRRKKKSQSKTLTILIIAVDIQSFYIFLSKLYFSLRLTLEEKKKDY